MFDNHFVDLKGEVVFARVTMEQEAIKEETAHIIDLWVDDIGLIIKDFNGGEFRFPWDYFSTFRISHEQGHLIVITNMFALKTTHQEEGKLWALYGFMIVFSTRSKLFTGFHMPDIYNKIPQGILLKLSTGGLKEVLCDHLDAEGYPKVDFIQNCQNFKRKFLNPRGFVKNSFDNSLWSNIFIGKSETQINTFFAKLYESGCGSDIGKTDFITNFSLPLDISIHNDNQFNFFKIEEFWFDDIGFNFTFNGNHINYAWDQLEYFRSNKDNNYFILVTNKFALRIELKNEKVLWLIFNLIVFCTSRSSLLACNKYPDIQVKVPYQILVELRKDVSLQEKLYKYLDDNGIPNSLFIDNCKTFREQYLISKAFED